MKYKKSKFLLIGLLVLSILISISAINATDNNTININTITANNTQDTINTQTSNNNNEKSIKSTIKSENKNKTVKKENTANNYEELYNTIETIKNTGTNSEETITLSPGNYNITKTINWGNTTQTTKTLIINGNGITLDGEGKYQFITVEREYTLNLENIKIQNCNSTYGAIIYNNGTVTIKNSTFINNTGKDHGGVSYNNKGTLTITHSNFTNNNATNNGGVNYNNNGNLTITNSNFTNNHATYGGVNYNNNGNLTITNSNFTNNNAQLRSGVNYNYGNLDINLSNFINNTSANGGVNYNYKNLTITDSNFTNNHAVNDGGVNGNIGNLTITDSNFINNHANVGGINYNNKGNLTITGSNFTNNYATNGGVNCNNGTLTITGSNFTNNHAVNGGVNNNTSNLTITDSNFTNNNATHGGVNNNNGNLDINLSNFINNTSENGGVNNNNNGNLTITNSNFTNNNATNNGGVNNNNGILTITGSNFKGNTAIEKGGCNYNNNYANMSIIDSNFTENKLIGRSVIYSDGTLIVNNSNFINSYDSNGTTIYDTNSLIIGNSSIIINFEVEPLKLTTIKSPIVYTKITPNEVNFTINNNETYTTSEDENFKTTQILGFGNNTVQITSDDPIYDTNTIQLKYEVISKVTIQNQTLPTTTIKTLTNKTIKEEIKDTNGNTLIKNIKATVTILDKTYNTTITNGTLNIQLETDKLPSEIYNITITIPENEYYYEATIKQQLNIEKRIIQNQTLPTTTIKIQENYTINTIVKDENGNPLVGTNNVTIQINNETIKTTITDGVLNIVLPTDKMEANTYTFTVNIEENNIYNAGQITGTLTIQKRDANITMNVTIPVTTGNVIANVTVTDNGNPVNGSVIFKVDNETFNVTIVDGKAQLNYTLPSDIEAGEHNITAELENPIYNANNITGTFTVTKLDIANTTINATIKTLENYTINTIIKDTNGNPLVGTNNVTVEINGETIKTTITDGVLNITLPTDKLPSEIYNITITIPENKYYYEATIKQQLNIEKRIIQNQTLPTTTIKTLTNKTISIVINDTESNTLSGNIKAVVKINGVTQIRTTIVNGLLNVTLKTDTFKNKNYEITIVVGETGYYTRAEIKQTLTIQKIQLETLKITTTTKYSYDNLIVNVKIQDKQANLVNNGYVIFKVDGLTLKDATGNSIKVKVENGTAILNITKTLTTRQHNLTVVYDGENIYEQTRETINFTIKKRALQNITINNITQLKGQNTKINITLKDQFNEQIKGETKIAVKINEKTSTQTTIKDGQLEIEIPTEKLNQKTYPITIKIEENHEYKSLPIEFNITIITEKLIKQTTVGEKYTITA